MVLSDILVPGAVKVLATAASKKRLLQDLSDMASQVYGLRAAEVLDALQDREALGATGVGHGVAVPHARIEGLTRVVGAFVRLERPIDFDAIDRLPVDLVFALFAPHDSGVEHLKALATVSRCLRDADLCAKLRANSDPTALYSVLVQGPRHHAA